MPLAAFILTRVPESGMLSHPPRHPPPAPFRSVLPFFGSLPMTAISRRRFLRAGALGLATPGLVAARVGTDSPRGAAEKSCIFILLCGGPSHLDTWDLKPAAPDEIR